MGEEMKVVFAALLALATMFGTLDLGFAQTKKDKGGGLTCAQKCNQFCQNKHHNCFDRCSSLRCNK